MLCGVATGKESAQAARVAGWAGQALTVLYCTYGKILIMRYCGPPSPQTRTLRRHRGDGIVGRAHATGHAKQDAQSTG
jgi:hypothetical protein